ncbi:hypothetical protein RMCBS344292_15899 [Rhizopus microsporus]|nr:hypothetical protein RMCBS344292_15899 [Rhizopus microsporus]
MLRSTRYPTQSRRLKAFQVHKYLPATGYDEASFRFLNDIQTTPSVCHPGGWRQDHSFDGRRIIYIKVRSAVVPTDWERTLALSQSF